MTPRTRLMRLVLWSAAANLGLFAVAATLASNTRASGAAHRFLVLCGLAG
jgi:hypothetical protein